MLYAPNSIYDIGSNRVVVTMNFCGLFVAEMFCLFSANAMIAFPAKGYYRVEAFLSSDGLRSMDG
jgi:hypothetical protein